MLFAAAFNDPVLAMASSNAIFPGPMAIVSPAVMRSRNLAAGLAPPVLGFVGGSRSALVREVLLDDIGIGQKAMTRFSAKRAVRQLK